MSFSLSTRAGATALLVLVVALPVAYAAPTKPAPGAKPTAPAAVGASLAAIEEASDKAEKDSHAALRRKRCDAITAYIKAAGSAKDAEAARDTLVGLNEELEDWSGVVAAADDYLKSHAEGENVGGVRLSHVQALTRLGKYDDAKKEFPDAIKGLVLEKHGANALWEAHSSYAELLALLGDIEGSKKAYQDTKDSMSNVRGVDEIAESALKGFDLIGTVPVAFPDDAKDLDGKVATLADFKGKVLLIDFWATWCPPCRAEVPHVVKTYDLFHAKGFEIVGISKDQRGDTEKLKAFISTNKMPWRQVYYPNEDDNKVAAAYEVNGIPHTVLVGRDGKILRTGLRGDWLLRNVEKAVSAK